MDGQCQDEFLHCTDPNLEQERINVTFRWIKRHAAFCPWRTGEVYFLPTCAQGSSAAVTDVGSGAFWALWVLLGVLCIWGVARFAGLSPMYTRLGFRRCAYRWTRPLGGGRWGHSLRDPWGVFWFAQKCARFIQGGGSDPISMVPYMIALAGQPSLHGYYACMVFWAKGAFWRNCRQILRKTSFSRFWVFLCSRKLYFLVEGCSCLASVDGRARHPGPGSASFVVKVSDVGGWLTHGDLVLDSEVDFFGCCGASVDPCWSTL